MVPLPKQHPKQQQFRWVWYSELGKPYEKDSIEDWDDEVKQDLRWLSSLPENRICADCGTTRQRRSKNGKPSECWASVNLGVFLCIRCTSYHRSLPNTISRPKSCSMDLWGPDEFERMKRVGNKNAIQMYGGTLPNNRPSPDASDSEWKHFLKQKYGEDRVFAPSKQYHPKHNKLNYHSKPTRRRTSGGAVSIELINFNDDGEIEQQQHHHQQQQIADVRKSSQGFTDISQLERDVSWLLSLICEHCAGRRRRQQQQQRNKYIETHLDPSSPLPSGAEQQQKNVIIELRTMTPVTTTGNEDGTWIESEFSY